MREHGGAGIGPDGLIDEEPRPRISPLRVLAALIVLAAAAAGIAAGLRSHLAAGAPVHGTWYAPYVDVTATPTYQFQDVTNNPARQVVLGFVVSGPDAPCTASWGGAYTEAQADRTLNLDSRIAQVRSEGAQVVVSFGGQKHTNLDVGCKNQRLLAAAYHSVISRYHLTAIDLDIEGDALDDQASIQRGADAIAAVQKQARAEHARLGVWLTLPVEPGGMQANAESVVTTMLRAHVDLAGINVMTMDFSHLQAEPDMLHEAEHALESTHDQMTTLFSQFGIELNSKQTWSRMGATVMIGQNDVAGQRVTVAQAKALTGFAERTGLGRISMWSLNRDAQCGSSFPVRGVMSTTCSGVAQSRLEFAKTLSRLDGTIAAASSHHGRLVTAPVDKNPADAPYPEWQPTEPYQTGYKVVSQGYIYQAKWYNQGRDPASQVQYAWQSPWLLVGPVVAGDHAPTLPTLPEGTYPDWSPVNSYQAGDRVLVDGLAYQAKWSSLGASPLSSTIDPWSSPWQPLFTIPGEPAGPS